MKPLAISSLIVAILIGPDVTSSAVLAAEIKAQSLPPLRSALTELVSQFERASGHKVAIEYGTPPELKERLSKGDTDVLIATKQIIAANVADGWVKGPTDVAKVGMGVAVRSGATRPDISSVDAFKRALINAKSIAYIDPASGAPGGIYLAKLFEGLGIASDLKPKTKHFGPSGAEAAVAAGEIELALSQMTVMTSHKGIEVVGPLPSEIQNYLEFSAGVLSASKNAEAGTQFIQFIVSPDSLAKMKARGFQ